MSFPHAELEQIGLQSLSFLSDNPEYLARFLDHSGLSVDDLKQNIQNQDLQTGILDFLFSDESLLMVFCSSYNIDPAYIQKLYTRISYQE